MSDSEEEEEEALLLDPDAIDQIARRQFGYRPTGWCHHGPKCNRAHCMTADNPAHRMFKNIEKEGGTRVEVDCQKVLPCPALPTRPWVRADMFTSPPGHPGHPADGAPQEHGQDGDDQGERGLSRHRPGEQLKFKVWASDSIPGYMLAT